MDLAKGEKKRRRGESCERGRVGMELEVLWDAHFSNDRFHQGIRMYMIGVNRQCAREWADVNDVDVGEMGRK